MRTDNDLYQGDDVLPLFGRTPGRRQIVKFKLPAVCQNGAS